MNQGEFVRRVQGLYDIWSDTYPPEPVPSWEELLEWIANDRRDARDLNEVKAELATFYECDESDMERMTEAEWHCTRKIYHKEGE